MRRLPHSPDDHGTPAGGIPADERSVRLRSDQIGQASLDTGLGGSPCMPGRDNLVTVWTVGASAVLAFYPPGGWRLARPAPEGAGEGAGFRIAQRRRDLGERRLGVPQQLPRDLEADLVRDGPIA